MILALVGQKGGVGKSTVAVCLAAVGLSAGRSVLLVDADPQGTARTWGELAGEAAERRRGRPAPKLERAPVVVAMGATMHRPGELPRVRADYDLIVIDCPPRAGDVQRSALMVADVALLPCGPSAADAWALASSLALVDEAKTLRAELRAAVLLTRKQARTSLGRGARGVLENCGLPILATELGYRIAYQEALAAGRGVTSYAPSGPAATEMRALWTEIQTFGRKPAHGRKTAG